MSGRNSERLLPPGRRSAAACRGSADLDRHKHGHSFSCMFNNISQSIRPRHDADQCKHVSPSSLTSVSHVPHGVFEGPDDGVQHQFKLGRRDGEECRKAVRVDSLEQVEEVGPVLWKFLKVLVEKQQMSRVNLLRLFQTGFYHQLHVVFQACLFQTHNIGSRLD